MQVKSLIIAIQQIKDTIPISNNNSKQLSSYH